MARSGIKDINKVIDWRRGTDYLRWNALMGKLMDRAFNHGLFEPVAKLYPEVKSSNYGGYIVTENNAVSDLNGHLQFSLAHSGTHNSTSFYEHIGALANQRLDGKEAYGRSPFAVLRWHLNTMRAAIRSSGDPIMPWVSNKQYGKSVFRDNPYYEELIYHLALSGADGFLYWNPNSREAHQNPFGLMDDEQDRLFDRCLRTINEHIGQQPRQCITTDPIPWDRRLLITGMRIEEDRFLWRITVLAAVEKIEVGDVLRRIDLNGAVGVWHETRTPQVPRIKIVRP